MPLSWNEIRDRALKFSREWADETSEDAEAKSFWDGFFDIFGVSRRRLASFEQPVKKSDGKGGFIDLLWRGILLVEHKSRGKDLDRAFKQATDYFPGLKERDLPRYVLVSDFARFRLFDLEGEQEPVEFPLKDLHKQVRRFGFIAGYQVRAFKDQDPANIKAAERMGKLHDALKASGYEGHRLEVLLVRLLFCLFAEDTGIFERRQLQDFIEQRTAEDGSDLGAQLTAMFQTLNTPEAQRSKALDAQLVAFPYVNGKLFAETLPMAAFDTRQRESLLEAAGMDWSVISPAIFGSLFQSIMDDKARRNLGAHYSSVKIILTLLHPLLLDDLRAEFDKIKSNRSKLHDFHEKLAALKFLDPACGCGNFLVVAYRELRQLELDVILAQYEKDLASGQSSDPRLLIKCNVDQFYGIEIEEFPAQIAQVALWLTDHQMNLRVQEAFGNRFVRLPLEKSAGIVHDNALRIDWNDVVPAEQLSFILGNPPFIGHQWRNADQMADMELIWGKDGRFGRLDYVTAWYRIATNFIRNDPNIRCAFVSTNSICQGEQVGILWADLLARGVKIHFAHRSFQWSNEAKGKAAVHCVIVGFGLKDSDCKWIFDYETATSDPHVIQADNINPYLVGGPNILLPSRVFHRDDIPAIYKGSQPTDGGNLVLDDVEKNQLLATFPSVGKFVMPYIGGDELINGTKRWCLWLKRMRPRELSDVPIVLDRIAKVQAFRLSSPTKHVRDFAYKPILFTQDRQPNEHYIAIPEVSSEARRFIPIGFLPPSVIASNKIQMVVGGGLWHFGVLTSTMHMAWVRAVGGRLKSDYSYSPSVYYNFPWPECANKWYPVIEAAAQGVLDARALFPDATLADLYDPLTMPPALVEAHQTLDRAVDAAYGKRIFKSDAERVAFLFERYQQLTSLLPVAPKKSARKRKTVADDTDN